MEGLLVSAQLSVVHSDTGEDITHRQHCVFPVYELLGKKTRFLKHKLSWDIDYPGKNVKRLKVGERYRMTTIIKNIPEKIRVELITKGLRT